jgi:hypothetical protein
MGHPMDLDRLSYPFPFQFDASLLVSAQDGRMDEEL